MTLLIILVVAVAIIIAVVNLRGGRPANRTPSGPPSQAEVERLIAAGDTIDAIKIYRQLTGLGLYEAKQAVDRIRATGAWEAPSATLTPPAGEDDAIVALIRENKLIEAIKIYREKYGTDLSTAKNAVDKLAGR